MLIKTLPDVIKFVNEYWDRYNFIKWKETPLGEEFIEGLAKLGDVIYYFSDDTLTSSGDF